MAKSKKKKPPTAIDMSRDEIMDLDKAALTSLLQRVLEQNKQFKKMLKDFVSEKSDKKTEHIENSDQLKVFDLIKNTPPVE